MKYLFITQRNLNGRIRIHFLRKEPMIHLLLVSKDNSWNYYRRDRPSIPYYFINQKLYLIKTNREASTCNLAKNLIYNYNSLVNHLHYLVYKKVVISHTLIDFNMQCRPATLLRNSYALPHLPDSSGDRSCKVYQYLNLNRSTNIYLEIRQEKQWTWSSSSRFAFAPTWKSF